MRFFIKSDPLSEMVRGGEGECFLGSGDAVSFLRFCMPPSSSMLGIGSSFDDDPAEISFRFVLPRFP